MGSGITHSHPHQKVRSVSATEPDNRHVHLIHIGCMHGSLLPHTALYLVESGC